MIRHRATLRFWECYDALPEEVQSTADRANELLQTSPAHRSLGFKQIGGLWSVRVGRSHRALAHGYEDEYIWMWIGTHAEFDQLLRSRRGL